MKKTLLSILTVISVSSIFGQSVPSDPLYEFSSKTGFTSLRRGDIVNPVTKISSTTMLTEDRFGDELGAIELSSTNYVTVDGEELDFGTGANKGFTVSVWMKPTATNFNYALFTKAKTNWLGSNDFDYGISYSTSDGLIFISGTSADNGNYFLSNRRPSTTSWNHLVMILDQTGTSSGTKKVFMNGIKIFDGTYSTKGVARVGADLIFGRSKDNSSFKGGIDDFYLYDRALTEAEALDLFNAQEVDNSSYPTLDLKFNGNTVDSSLYANEVTSKNITYSTDRHGNANSALYMNTAQSLPLIVKHENNLNFGRVPGREFTMSFWFKSDVINTSPTLISKAKNNWVGSADFDYGFGLTTNDELIPFTGPSSDVNNYPQNIITTNDNLWHHVVMACEQTGTLTGNKRVYFDGIEVFSGSYNSKGSIQTGDLIFGRGKSGIPYFIGSFDDVLIYRKSLTAAEVQNLYNTNLVTSLTSNEEKEKLSIYPNPASSVINTAVGQLEILDLTGNLVLSTESNGKVDVSSLEAGIYIVTQNGRKGKLIIE